MKKIYAMKTYLKFALLATGALVIAGCHNSGPAASPELVLPVVEQGAITAEILADGSVLIPEDTIVEHIGTKGVFILSKDNMARFRMVKAGKESGDSVSISSGLVGGEQILTGPYENLFDGSPVQLTKE